MSGVLWLKETTDITCESLFHKTLNECSIKKESLLSESLVRYTDLHFYFKHWLIDVRMSKDSRHKADSECTTHVIMCPFVMWTHEHPKRAEARQ